MDGVSTAYLRDIISRAINETIEIHRSSREAIEKEEYVRPHGAPTDDEIDDFINCDVFVDRSADGLLRGFLFLRGNYTVYNVDIDELQMDCREWSRAKKWLSADLPWIVNSEDIKPERSQIWTPDNKVSPKWVRQSKAYLLIAIDLLEQGRLLSEMSWRDFENLLGALLESEGWNVKVMRGTKDGGIDVTSERHNETTGMVKALWQAKKYGIDRKVRLSEVRELSGTLSRSDASKAIIVTTSHLTRGAIDWVRHDKYRMAAKQREDMEYWVRKSVLGKFG